jgi:hypothetical protein
MALQIRRGSEAQRQSLSGASTPSIGEPLFTTDTKKLFIGDGSTTGGVALGYYGSVNVAGQDSLSAAQNTDTLTLIAGDNIVLTTNATNDSITISAPRDVEEFNTGSINIFQNNIVGLNSNENIVIDPSGTGIVTINSGLTVTGTITGNLTGNASTVTNGIYTTDTGTVTNTMLAGNIANDKLVNSSLTIGSTAISLGSTSTTLTGLTSLTSTSVTSESLNLSGLFSNQYISIDENRIRTLNSNESIFLDPAGTGVVNIASTLVTSGIQIFGPASGGASGDGNILVVTQSSSAIPLNILKIHNTGSTVTGGVNLGRARGSIVTQTAVQNNDTINQFIFTGYDGTAYRLSSAITASVAGAVSSNLVPGKLDFSTVDASGNLISRLSVSSTEVASTIPVKLAVYADTTARDTTITSPTAGMMIFLTAGTKFQGYTGAAWVDLN